MSDGIRFGPVREQRGPGGRFYCNCQLLSPEHGNRPCGLYAPGRAKNTRGLCGLCHIGSHRGHDALREDPDGEVHL